MTFNKQQYMQSLERTVAEHLVNCKPENIVAINTALSSAMCSPFSLTNFIVGAIQEAESNDMYDEIVSMTDKLNKIICGGFDWLDALEFATDIVWFYEHEIEDCQTVELEEEDYSLVTAGL
jgi:hypothetical protein